MVRAGFVSSEFSVMTNWRTNLGGAIGTLGGGLRDLGVVWMGVNFSDPGGVATRMSIWMIIIGSILSAIGRSVTALFAADAKEIQVQLDAHSQQIQSIASETKEVKV